MEIISYFDRGTPQAKVAQLLKRFKGSYVRLYEFTNRYRFTDETRRILADRILRGDTLHLTGADYLRQYPHTCAHIIAHSLGYATPLHAGNILRDAMETGRNNCEWIDACYRKDARRMLKDAITGRHRHNRYMADYGQALYLVRSELNGTGKTELASWF